MTNPQTVKTDLDDIEREIIGKYNQAIVKIRGWAWDILCQERIPTTFSDRLVELQTALIKIAKEIPEDLTIYKNAQRLHKESTKPPS